MSTPQTSSRASSNRSPVHGDLAQRQSGSDATHLLAPELCYWSLVDLPKTKPVSKPHRHNAMTQAGPIPHGVMDLVADDLPIAPSHVHAVGIVIEHPNSIEEHKLLVCAVDKQMLTSLRTDLLWCGPASALQLHANAENSISATPHNSDEQNRLNTAAQRLNLLVGEFEPFSIRRAHFRRHALVAACLLLCCFAIGGGLLRRAQAWESASATLRNQLKQSAPRTTGSLPLSEEVTQLRNRLTLTERVQPSPDVSTDLADMLRAWSAASLRPSLDVEVRPLSLSINGQRVLLNLLLNTGPNPSTVDPTQIIDSFRAPASPRNWVRDEPSISRHGSDTVRAQLTFRRELPSQGPASRPAHVSTKGESVP